MIRHGIQVLGACQDVERLDERVVQEEHDCGGVPDPFPVVEQHLAQVAYVAHFWVSQAKFPDDERGVEHEGGYDDCEDQARD